MKSPNTKSCHPQRSVHRNSIVATLRRWDWHSFLIIALIMPPLLLSPSRAAKSFCSASVASDCLRHDSTRPPSFQQAPCCAIERRRSHCRQHIPLITPTKHVASFINLSPKGVRPNISSHYESNSHNLNYLLIHNLKPKRKNLEKSSPFTAAVLGNESEHDVSMQPGKMFRLRDEEELDDETNASRKILDNYFGLMMLDSGDISLNENNTKSIGRNQTNMVNSNNTEVESKKKIWRRVASGMKALIPGRPLILRLLPSRPSYVDDAKNEILQSDKRTQSKRNDTYEVLEESHFNQNRVDSNKYAHSRSILNNAIPNNESSLVALTFLNQSLPRGDPNDFTPELNHTSIAIKEENSQQPNREEDCSSISGKKRIRNSFSLRNRKPKATKDNSSKSDKRELYVSKEEIDCPVIVSNIHGLRDAVLVNEIPLKDVGFRFPLHGIGSDLLNTWNDSFGTNSYRSKYAPTSIEKFSIQNKKTTKFQRHDPVINGTLSSYLTSKTIASALGSKARQRRNSTKYQEGIELINLHPVLSLVRERVLTNSTPGNRKSAPNETAPHLALVIEGGGMRGAVSAGMAAALSTLDLLNAFDSIHGSSAGAIVGAYLVSRQLCTDVYTDIMPAAGSRFASSKRVMLNVGVDWLGDLVKRKLLVNADDRAEGSLDKPYNESEDELCVLIEGGNEANETGDFHDGSSWLCDDGTSSVELAMGKISGNRRRLWSDDHYDGIIHESATYLLSNAFSFARSTVSKPISFGMRQAASALRPALSALDFASSMRQYLRRKPGMNITFVLDGVMDETHGLRPFDMDAFRANDKMQPLYVVASTVSRGGSGDMETLAFNSADGDFFGLSEEDTKVSTKGEGLAWYTRCWNLFKRTPYALYSVVRSMLFSNPDIPPVPSASDPPLLPPGTTAMFGLANRQRKDRAGHRSANKYYEPTGRADGNGKNGLFPCLEASMLVPGAAGPPIRLIRSMNRRVMEKNRRFPSILPRRQSLKPPPQDLIHICYDAFVYESIPYRSAVEKAGATHVLALRSRPDGCVVETRQHIYERVVGPIYFRKHGMNKVARLFSSGGSQYRYIEDILTLDEGLAHGIALGLNCTSLRNTVGTKGVKIPPTKILYGDESRDPIGSTNDWKEAHLLPLTLPFGTPELPALTQDKEEVMNAVRFGYAAAFDVLAPVAGLPFDSRTIPGERVAELIFPDGDDDIDSLEILDRRVKVKPSYIHQGEEIVRTMKDDEEERFKRRSFAEWITGKREERRKEQEKLAAHPEGVHAKIVERRKSLYHESDQYVRDDANTLEWLETEALLAALPGFRGGRLDHIADSLLSKDERKKEKEK